MFILDERWPEFLLSEKKKVVVVVVVDVWEGGGSTFDLNAASFAVVIKDARSAFWHHLFRPLGGAARFAGS